MEKLIAVCTENLLIIVSVAVAVAVYAFAQALVSMLRDWFLVKFFKKNLNGSNHKGNGKMEALMQEFITVARANGVTQQGTREAVEGMSSKVGDMHDIVCEKDENKFPKIRVMEKKVREIWNKVIRGVDG